MQTYVWSCFSCGTANAPEAQWCQRCECPARATVAEMTHYRRRFEGESDDPLALDNGILRGAAIFLFSHSIERTSSGKAPRLGPSLMSDVRSFE